MGLDEFAAGRHLVAHQDREDAVGFEGIFNLNPLHHAGGGIHGGFPELLGHHFTEALKALDRVIGLLTKAFDRLLEVAFVVAIGVIFAALHLVERRTSDINVAAFHQGLLITEEEGEDQGTNVGAVHVGVSHNDDPVITKILLIEFFAPNAKAKGRNQGLDFGVFVDLGVVGFLDVENLAAQGQDGLKTTIPALLGRTASGIPFHDVDLGFAGITG